MATGPRRRADVARGSTAPLRRGAEATWQGRVWPTRGAGGADAWQEPHGRSTWAPVRGATWQKGSQVEGPRVSGP